MYAVTKRFIALSLLAASLSQVAPAFSDDAAVADKNATSSESLLNAAEEKAVVNAAETQLRAYGGKQKPMPGVYIAIYAPGKAPFFKSVGVADIKTKAPFKLADRFRIGSNTKTFVISVILQLQDEKLLKVDDPISKFDIGVKIPNAEHITIRQLAEMRSGLFEAYDTKQFNRLHITGSTTLTPNQLISWAVANKPRFAPGAKWNYSNTNYLILGRIIEVVTKDSYANQVRKRLIERYGLRETTVPETVKMPTPYAHGYQLNARGNWEDASETLGPSITWAAGNMVSTVPDMARWVKLYVTGKVSSEESQKDRMKCVRLEPDSTMSFGMGIGSSNGWFGYTGGLPGYNTAAYYNPDKDMTLIAFVTSQKEKPSPGVANCIVRDITKIITPSNVIFGDLKQK